MFFCGMESIVSTPLMSWYMAVELSTTKTFTLLKSYDIIFYVSFGSVCKPV